MPQDHVSWCVCCLDVLFCWHCTVYTQLRETSRVYTHPQVAVSDDEVMQERNCGKMRTEVLPSRIHQVSFSGPRKKCFSIIIGIKELPDEKRPSLHQYYNPLIVLLQGGSLYIYVVPLFWFAMKTTTKGLDPSDFFSLLFFHRISMRADIHNNGSFAGRRLEPYILLLINTLLWWVYWVHTHAYRAYIDEGLFSCFPS